MIPRTMTVATVALLATGSLVGCSTSDDPAPGTSAPAQTMNPRPSKTVKVNELEDDIRTKVNAQGKTQLEKVDCPDVVEAKVDVKFTCTATAVGGETKDYEVTLTKVDGNDVGYSAEPKG